MTRRTVENKNIVLRRMAIKTKLTDLRPAREKYSRTITLLSGGKINGEFFENGQITVYPWDYSVDEWLANKLRKGNTKGRTILYNVLPQVCNLNGCPMDRFLASETMMVLMVARSILRNDCVTFDAACPACGARHENTIKIPDQLEKIGQKGPDWPGYDIIILNESKEEVKIRPVTIGEEISVIDRPESARRRCSDSIARLLCGVTAINDSVPDNADEAIRWFAALPPGDGAQLLEDFEKFQPALSQTVHVVCDADDCGKEFDHVLQLNEDFFRRPSVASDRGTVENNVRPGVQVEGAVPGPNASTGAAAAKNAGVARRAGS